MNLGYFFAPERGSLVKNCTFDKTPYMFHFGLFSTHLPYIILGVTYFLYFICQAGTTKLESPPPCDNQVREKIICQDTGKPDQVEALTIFDQPCITGSVEIPWIPECFCYLELGQVCSPPLINPSLAYPLFPNPPPYSV